MMIRTSICSYTMLALSLVPAAVAEQQTVTPTPNVLHMKAMSGNAAAQTEYGKYWLAQKNANEAIKWFKMAAEQGNAEGERYMGICYMRGLGTEKNLASAVSWLTKSAEHGDMGALTILGVCIMEDGEKPELAMRSFMMAAERDYLTAQYLLGKYSYEGPEAVRNIEQAKKWLKIAADHGHEEAKALYDQIMAESTLPKASVAAAKVTPANNTAPTTTPNTAQVSLAQMCPDVRFQVKDEDMVSGKVYIDSSAAHTVIRIRIDGQLDQNKDQNKNKNKPLASAPFSQKVAWVRDNKTGQVQMAYEIKSYPIRYYTKEVDPFIEAHEKQHVKDMQAYPGAFLLLPHNWQNTPEISRIKAEADKGQKDAEKNMKELFQLARNVAQASLYARDILEARAMYAQSIATYMGVIDFLKNNPSATQWPSNWISIIPAGHPHEYSVTEVNRAQSIRSFVYNQIAKSAGPVYIKYKYNDTEKEYKTGHTYGEVFMSLYMFALDGKGEYMKDERKEKIKIAPHDAERQVDLVVASAAKRLEQAMKEFGAFYLSLANKEQMQSDFVNILDYANDSPENILERIFVSYIKEIRINGGLDGDLNKTLSTLNQYMDKIIADTNKLIGLIEKMNDAEKMAVAQLLISYMETHLLADDSEYKDMHLNCGFANPVKYGVFQGLFKKMMSMLPMDKARSSRR